MTDSGTDRILIARPRLHSMQRGKNITVTRKNTLRQELRVILLQRFKASESGKVSKPSYRHLKNYDYAKNN